MTSGLKVYKASAGSGKTYTLALEYIKEILLNPAPNAHRHVLAVTFTKDATGEMKDRILAELYGLAAGCEDSAGFLASIRKALADAGKPMEPAGVQRQAQRALHDILHDYSRLHITTIDSFFQKVLRNLARELGKGSKFNLEMNSYKVLADAVYSMIENANENPQLLNWLTTYIEGKLNDGGNWRIEREVLNFSKCIFNEYFQEHEQKLRQQLDENPMVFEQLRSQHSRTQKEAKDFFKKTFAEITALMENRHLQLNDFSRKGVVINFFRKLSEGDSANVDPHGQTIADCRIHPDKWASSKNPRAAEISDLAAERLMPLLNTSIETLIRYNTSRMITDNIYQLGLIRDITGEINRQNTENNRFMLADTALFLHRMIDDSDAPFIYEKIGAEIRHVMIDEFQDTSRIQWRNFKSLLSDILANNYFSMIVGDVKQSIYRWRNGDWRILGGIRHELRADVQSLSFNYRSEPHIISFNNALFAKSSSLLNDLFYTLFDSSSESPFPSAYDPVDVAQKTHKKDAAGYVSIDFIPVKTDSGKYSELVLKKLSEQLLQLHAAGVAAEDICILTRTNQHIVDIAAYLSTQKENHPALAGAHYLNIVSNEAFRLNSSPAVRIIIEALRVLSDPENPVCKVQLQVFFNKYVRQTESKLSRLLEKQELLPLLAQKQEELVRMPLFELTGHLFRILEVEKIAGQSNYMFSFYDAIQHYLKDYPADIPAFLRYWDDDLQFKSVPSGTGISGVRAMTVHKSKGLQFHTVIVPFCDWSLNPEKNPIIWCTPKDGLYDVELLPVKYSENMYDTVFLKEYEEETVQSWMDNLNLLYVAFTRAERNLLITGKYKKDLAAPGNIKNVSNLMQYCINELNGVYDDANLRFEYGALDGGLPRAQTLSDNLLKTTPESFDIRFLSKAFNPEKSIFKQSNKSREFIAGDESASAESAYILKGNIMHALFSQIKTMDDIPHAVDRLSDEGLIPREEKGSYRETVFRAIKNAKVEDWFSEKYRVYNECSILTEENGTITTKRPDRVLMNDTQTIIIDYKFGEPHASHHKQIEQYRQLMQQMGYPHPEAFLWYVGQVVRIIPVPAFKQQLLG
ncbi:MAG: UvrD-helicase domain-containing protein [Dysgonamonadaceae bacterium]|jgi:ATP-dependent exoDNAse (exonuclease V) beta subunit|nr:UvrD-helicase domain-containing protein [Dysgonamonadaceae bacterium]